MYGTPRAPNLTITGADKPGSRTVPDSRGRVTTINPARRPAATTNRRRIPMPKRIAIDLAVFIQRTKPSSTCLNSSPSGFPAQSLHDMITFPRSQTNRMIVTILRRSSNPIGTSRHSVSEGSRPPIWFALDETRPPAGVVGRWQKPVLVRKVKEGRFPGGSRGLTRRRRHPGR